LFDDRRSRIRIRETQKQVDPVDPDPGWDPDPEHCFKDKSPKEITVEITVFLHFFAC
jgi:hypothetical protein